MAYSKLMMDSSEGGVKSKTEGVLDYILSWSLRNSTKDVKESKPILYDYCLYMLCKLLDIEDYKNVEIVNIKVYKQWKNIDLLSEVEITNNGTEEKHVIVIEDKIYSSISGDQLERYKQIAESYYNNGNNWILHFALVAGGFERSDPKIHMYDHALEVGYKVLSFDEMVHPDGYVNNIDTESDIFNEFWLRSWY